MRRAWLSALCVLSVLSWAADAAPAPDGVTIEAPQQAVEGRIVATGQIRYRIRSDDAGATLGYNPSDHSLLLSVDAPGGPPSLALQARLLDPLLTRLLQDHGGVDEFYVTLRDRDAIFARLDPVLATSPAWNGRTGAPRHGDTTALIVRTVRDHDLVREIRQVFAAHGYTLSLRSGSLVSVEPVPALGGGRLPTDMGSMNFFAERRAKGRHQGT